MAEGTVNVPGGPAYVFGKKNTAHTGPESAKEPGSVSGDTQSVINEINANSSAPQMTADDAADNVSDSMADAVDKYWEESDVDVIDTATEYMDEHLPRGEYSEDEREEYHSSLVQRLEDSEGIGDEVGTNVYGAIKKSEKDAEAGKGPKINPNDYMEVSFNNKTVKEYFDHVARSEAESFGGGDQGIPSNRTFM